MELEPAIARLPKIPSGVYQHYRGGLYWVSGVVSIDEESGKYRVQYWSLVKRVWWGREYVVFVEWADFSPPLIYNPDRRPTPRFVRLGGRLLWWWIRLRYALGLLTVPS